MKRIFPARAVKLRPQTSPIDKREIGYAAISEERRIHNSPSAHHPSPPPPTRAISQWARSLEWGHAMTFHRICISFFLLWRHALSSSIMTLCMEQMSPRHLPYDVSMLQIPEHEQISWLHDRFHVYSKSFIVSWYVSHLGYNFC